MDGKILTFCTYTYSSVFYPSKMKERDRNKEKEKQK